MRTVLWIGPSLDIVKGFAANVRREIGYQLFRLQSGMEPTDWRSMPSIGAGAREIRIRAGGQYRVIYVAKFSDGIYVLHAFAKKSRKTSKHDLELAKQCYRDMQKLRAT